MSALCAEGLAMAPATARGEDDIGLRYEVAPAAVVVGRGSISVGRTADGPPPSEVQRAVAHMSNYDESSPSSSTEPDSDPGSADNVDNSDPSITREVPLAILQAAAAAAAQGRPASLAGLPPADFWRRLQEVRSDKPQDHAAWADRLVRFREKYGWPLTICTSDIARALRSGAHQYLPPRAPNSRPLVTFVPKRIDERLCAIEEYQMLATFALEAAFRADAAAGAALVVDLRGTATNISRTLFASFADLARGVALISGSVPTRIVHVQLIEDASAGRVARAAVGLLLSRFSAKLRARIHRGGAEAAVEALGAELLPRELGGTRDAEGEWRAWLAARRDEEEASGFSPSGSAPWADHVAAKGVASARACRC